MFSDISGTILATAVFLFFILPGVAFLRDFWHDDKGALQDSTIMIYLIWGTPISFIFFTFIYWLYFALFEITRAEMFNVNLDYIHGSITKNIPLEAQRTYNLIHYTIVTSFLAWFVGTWLRRRILRKKLDVRYPILRFNHDWLYLLTGRDISSDPEDLIITTARVLCVLDHGTIVYKGNVYDFNLKKDGGLEYVVLKYTEIVQGTLDGENRHIDDSFIIMGHEIKNISCTYRCFPNINHHIDVTFETDDEGEVPDNIASEDDSSNKSNED